MKAIERALCASLVTVCAGAASCAGGDAPESARGVIENGHEGGFGDAGPDVLTCRNTVHLFLSGHSLINLDMPWNVDQLAAANGRTYFYNEQMGIGSSLEARLGGADQQDAEGKPVVFNVLDEIRNAQTLPGGRKYDTLVLTEAAGIASHVVFANTVANAMTFYDALIYGNASGRVFLYDSWEDSAGDVPSWITKTRRDHTWYECVASAVNKDPVRSTRPLLLLPAGVTLTTVAEAIEAGQLPQLTSAATLFSDDGHHASDLGNYTLALTVYVATFGCMPETSAVTPTARFGRPYAGPFGGATITAIRDLVWKSVTTFYQSGQNNRRSMAECRQLLPQNCGSVTSAECNEGVSRIFTD